MDQSMLTDRQRINLIIDANHLTLYVPREEEQTFRQAGTYVNERIQGYKTKYPNSKLLPAGCYLLMSAVDAAYYYLKSAKKADSQPVHDKITVLNRTIEDFLLSNRY
ncbi:cell division protein ZapA [Porphyromonas macacae]|nr:cell division protein ZapA [Porphyromonas macacae]